MEAHRDRVGLAAPAPRWNHSQHGMDQAGSVAGRGAFHRFSIKLSQLTL